MTPGWALLPFPLGVGSQLLQQFPQKVNEANSFVQSLSPTPSSPVQTFGTPRGGNPDNSGRGRPGRGVFGCECSNFAWFNLERDVLVSNSSDCVEYIVYPGYFALRSVGAAPPTATAAGSAT